MNHVRCTHMKVVLSLAALLLTIGCDKFVETSRSAQAMTKQALQDSAHGWVDVFTYHPRKPDQMPQTRYCYQMQSDIVCYDSEQARLTSKLVGYQEGENISWVQQGGGSLGASGGPPISLKPPEKVKYANTQQSGSRIGDAQINTGPVSGQSAIVVNDLVQKR